LRLDARDRHDFRRRTASRTQGRAHGSGHTSSRRMMTLLETFSSRCALRFARSISLSVAITPFSARAQQSVPARHYSKPVWTSSEGFSSTPAVRLLRDGRIIASDFKNKEVWLLSPAGKFLGQVAQRGGGPK